MRVHRLTRAKQLPLRPICTNCLAGSPELSVETATQTTATAVNVTATVTGDETISITGLVAVPGDLLTANFDELAHPSYLLLDEFSGDSATDRVARNIFFGSVRRVHEKLSRRAMNLF